MCKQNNGSTHCTLDTNDYIILNNLCNMYIKHLFYSNIKKENNSESFMNKLHDSNTAIKYILTYLF